MTNDNLRRTAPMGTTPRALSALWPFMRPYRGHLVLAALFLVLAALTTLALPMALRLLIDQGLVSSDPGERLMQMREHFLALFGVGAALGVFSAARYFMVSWLGERITSNLKEAVYAHVLRQSPEFFETTQTGEVVSRLTADTTLIQTLVGTSISMARLICVAATVASSDSGPAPARTYFMPASSLPHQGRNSSL